MSQENSPPCRRVLGEVVDASPRGPAPSARRAFWMLEATSSALSACTVQLGLMNMLPMRQRQVRPTEKDVAIQTPTS